MSGTRARTNSINVTRRHLMRVVDAPSLNIIVMPHFLDDNDDCMFEVQNIFFLFVIVLFKRTVT